MAKDSAKWVETIKNPLKIGIVVIDKGKGNSEMTLQGDNIVQRAIRESGAYKTVDVTDLRPSLNLKNKKGFDAFLDRCSRKGLAILLCVYADKLEIKTIPQGTAPGDSAKEFSTVASAQAFSTKRKRMHSHVSVRERISILDEKTEEERDGIRNELLRQGVRETRLKTSRQGHSLTPYLRFPRHEFPSRNFHLTVKCVSCICWQGRCVCGKRPRRRESFSQRGD